MKGEPCRARPFFRDSGDETQTLLDGDQNPHFQGVEDLEIHPDYCNLRKSDSVFPNQRVSGDWNVGKGR